MSEATIERIEARSGQDKRSPGLRTVRHSSRRPRANTGRARLAVVPPNSAVDAPTPQATGSLVEQYPAATTITVTHESVVRGDLAETLWRDYTANFGPLADLAILRHVDTRESFIAQLANPRIVKIICWVDHQPAALGFVTNSLDDVEEISPAFLRAKYPEQAARDAIYVGMLVMVSQPMRGKTLFSRLYTELWQVPALAGGILIWDVCEFNRTIFKTDTLAEQIAAAFPHSSVEVADRQTWYAVHLPEPIPVLPSRN